MFCFFNHYQSGHRAAWSRTNQFELLFARVEGLFTKIKAGQLISESSKAICQINVNEMRRDNELDPVKMHHPMMDQAQANIAYSYKFPGWKIHPRTLEAMVSNGNFFWNSGKMFHGNSKVGAQSLLSRVYVDAVFSDPTVSAATVPSAVHAAEMESPAPESCSKSIPISEEIKSVEVGSASKTSIFNKLQLMRV